MIDLKALLRALTVVDAFTIDGELQRVVAVDRLQKRIVLAPYDAWETGPRTPMAISDLAAMLDDSRASWDVWARDNHPSGGPVIPRQQVAG